MLAKIKQNQACALIKFGRSLSRKIDDFMNDSMMKTDSNDEYLWLEEINSKKSLDWVSQQNGLTQKIGSIRRF